MPKHIIGLLIALPLMLLSKTTKAETMVHRVPLKTINQTLASQFPFSKSFQGTAVTFSEPKAVINTLDKTLKLQIMLTSSRAGNMLLVKATFDGKLLFDNFSEAYLFEEMRLDTFKIQTAPFSDSKSIEKTIKQSLINDFQDIVMVNLEQFGSELPKRQADKIDISLKQVEFIWHK